MDNIYIVTYYDEYTEQIEKIECKDTDEANMVYSTLYNQTGVKDLHIVEYDVINKTHHLYQL